MITIASWLKKYERNCLFRTEKLKMGRGKNKKQIVQEYAPHEACLDSYEPYALRKNDHDRIVAQEIWTQLFVSHDSGAKIRKTFE